MEHFHEHEEAFPLPTSYKIAGAVVMVAFALAAGSAAALILWTLASTIN